jgi:uncharacterized membrane protein
VIANEFSVTSTSGMGAFANKRIPTAMNAIERTSVKLKQQIFFALMIIVIVQEFIAMNRTTMEATAYQLWLI